MRLAWVSFGLLVSYFAFAQSYQESVQQLLCQCAETTEFSDFPYPNTQFLKQHPPVWQKGALLKVKPYRAYLYFFEFADSVATERALDYFLNHTFFFGKPMERCMDLQGFKSPPAIYIVGQNSISILNQMCEEPEAKRNSIQNLFIGAFAQIPLTYRITVGCGGPVIWDCP